MVAIRRRVMRGLYEGYFFYVYLTLWVFQVLFFL